ncbi:chalcone isomerase family protein [Bdellovibrio svalbardensis]|uniref:Chalcone isomerase family protein n=1 Tax=Bdellovibrio svalbardensis TaxID=2972972 RepID=A0ABT6DFY9_9BACT|nr:chalcone isomerase family protein [Bdellovibrio svalbardensis]MDG0815752.1 chalcone isomerase family protein [Bdellovibrio svalbardensis]
MKSVSNFLVSSALVLTCSLAQASLLKLEKGPRTVEGINISQSADAIVGDQSVHLGTVGAGVRWKKILLAKLKVYVAQLMVESPDRFIKKDKEALKSLDDSSTVAIQLTFLRTVDAPTVQNSFRDALMANKIDLSHDAVKTFLSAVKNGGDATSGNSLTILIQKHSDGTETLVYEDSTGMQTQVQSDKGLTQKILAIWLGTPSDDGVASCKSDLLSNN